MYKRLLIVEQVYIVPGFVTASVNGVLMGTNFTRYINCLHIPSNIIADFNLTLSMLWANTVHDQLMKRLFFFPINLD